MLMPTQDKRGFNTRALDPQIPWLLPKTHTMPVFLTSTYTMDSLEPPAYQEIAFKYPRIAYPNGEMLEHTIASLENGEEAAGAADGMRAISLTINSILHPSRQGTIVSTSPLYSDTYRFFMMDIVPRGKQYMFLNSPESCVDDFKILLSCRIFRSTSQF